MFLVQHSLRFDRQTHLLPTDTCKISMNKNRLDPSPDNIGTTRDRGSSIVITWFMPPCCYEHLHSILTYTQGDTKHVAQLTNDVTKHTLYNLMENVPFDVVIVAVYDDETPSGRQAASDTYTFTSQAETG